jgi:hypothetical protein
VSSSRLLWMLFRELWPSSLVCFPVSSSFHTTALHLHVQKVIYQPLPKITKKVVSDW